MLYISQNQVSQWEIDGKDSRYELYSLVPQPNKLHLLTGGFIGMTFKLLNIIDLLKKLTEATEKKFC